MLNIYQQIKVDHRSPEPKLKTTQTIKLTAGDFAIHLTIFFVELENFC